MKTKTQKVPCPKCGVPVPMPKQWDGPSEESLCNGCASTMEQPHHTPTPWRIRTAKNGDIEIIDEKYNPIAKMVFYPDNLDRKTSEQIVRAVNAHEAMARALKMVIEDDEYGRANETGGIFQATLSAVKQAIAKAEGK